MRVAGTRKDGRPSVRDLELAPYTVRVLDPARTQDLERRCAETLTDTGMRKDVRERHVHSWKELKPTE